MDISGFTEAAPGRLVRVPSGYVAFVPDPLPPRLESSWELANAVSEADRALSRLAGIVTALPNPALLVAPFVRREAVLSSRIEGTQASLSQLLAFEADGNLGAPADVLEVANYVRALDHGLARLADLPLALRLIREIHGVLMEGVAGPHTAPGEFRRTQNWIGPPGSTLSTATYVPPPPPEMMEALSAFEGYLHQSQALPPLLRLGLIHYQFEAIHPFLDGNGRIGRLLVTLLLCAEGHISAPIPYLSAFIERHRSDYYRLLLGVSQRGEWIPWLKFFLRALSTQSGDAAERGAQLLAVRQRYLELAHTARATMTMSRAVDLLVQSPVVTIGSLARDLQVTVRTAAQIVARLSDLGIIAESTGRRRGRVFVAREVLAILER